MEEVSIMVRHVVFFKMKKSAMGKSASDNAKELASRFQEISGRIDEVIACETGMNYNGEKQFYELCLNQTFESRQALADYLVHPLHLVVREHVLQVIDHRIVVDYDL